MAKIRSYIFKSIAKYNPRPCYSYRIMSSVSNDQKASEMKVTEDKKSASSDNIKAPVINNYDSLLPDDKGDINVCIVGGGTASLCAAMLLKQCRIIKRVHLIDPKGLIAGAVSGVSHIDTSTRIKYFTKENIRQGLKEVNIIALMDETDVKAECVDPVAQFNAAANYVREVTEQIMQFSPDSLVAVFAKPITATLPMISGIYKCAGWWDPSKIIGSTSLESMRTEALTSNCSDLNPAFLSVPMIGGADPYTIVPLFSRAKPINQFTEVERNMLLNSLRDADEKIAIVENRSLTLSVGAAATKLILTLARALSGFENVTTCAFVRSNVFPMCRYFTTELQLGPGGVEQNFGLPKVSPWEVSLIQQAVPLINKYAEMGEKAVHMYRQAHRKHL